MTPEEKYHSDKWFVLQQIKEKELYTPKSKQSLHMGFGNYRVWQSGIQYRLNITPNSIHEKCPPSKQINILRQLVEEGALKIVHEENEAGYGAYYLFILEIIRPKFDELYEKYRRQFDAQYALRAEISEDIAKGAISELFRDGVKTVTITDEPSVPDKRKAQLEALKRVVEKGAEREKMKKEIIEELKSEGAETQQHGTRPYCVIEGKWGFLKFSKQSQKIKISNANAQPFKLLKCLTEPFGTAKSVDVVFEAVRENIKYKSKRGVYTNSIDRAQKIKIIEYAIKELQKDNKLQGKLVFRWDDLKIKLWLEHLG